MNTCSKAEPAADWSAIAYADNARFVADLAASLVDWLAVVPGERVLDLGCGDGALTERLVAAGASVLGMDASAQLLAAARDRGLDVVQGDGQAMGWVLASSGADQALFDAVFSNAALHWMSRDPNAVITGVYKHLKPGGRFVAEFGAQGNIQIIRDALHAETSAMGLSPDDIDPWFFPREKDYLKQLTDAGFSIIRHECFSRPTPLPGDISAWLETLAWPFVEAAAMHTSRPAFIAAVRERLSSSLQGQDGSWSADYVRLRFVVEKPVEDR